MIPTFRKLHLSDIKQFRAWLEIPEIKKVWQEPADEREFTEKFLKRLPERGVKAFIFDIDGKPFGYIQYYNAKKVGGGWWENEIQGTFGIDLLIGDTTQWGKGLGPKIIEEFISYFTKIEIGVKSIIIGPGPENLRAIKAFEKAGFVKEGVIEIPGGKAQLMRIAPAALKKIIEKRDGPPVDPKQFVRARVIEMLRLLSSVEEQLLYQKNVPFVNVPDELLCMWFDDLTMPGLLKTAADRFSKEELLLLTRFNEAFYKTRDHIRGRMLIADLHKLKEWKDVVVMAGEVLKLMESADKKTPLTN